MIVTIFAFTCCLEELSIIFLILTNNFFFQYFTVDMDHYKLHMDSLLTLIRLTGGASTPLQIILITLERLWSPQHIARCASFAVVKDTACIPPSHYDAISGSEEVGNTIIGLTRSRIGVFKMASICECNRGF